MKVYGTQQITESLHENTKLKGLNLFKNTLDVDGARAVGMLLQYNSTIEFVDLGHNRIRNKGLEAIKDGILANTNSKIHSLGLRMNFISDDGFDSFFNDLIFDNFSKLKVVYLPTTINMEEMYKYSKGKLVGTESFGDSKQNK